MAFAFSISCPALAAQDTTGTPVTMTRDTLSQRFEQITTAVLDSADAVVDYAAAGSLQDLAKQGAAVLAGRGGNPAEVNIASKQWTLFVAQVARQGTPAITASTHEQHTLVREAEVDRVARTTCLWPFCPTDQ
ncbi:MAG TPA: hypothetical protein VFJ16_13635 [Longimicrobium sp.]|nr:hypothetical protein [Longimicrobium sp.]